MAQLHLKHNSKIAIIGAGPAGAFFAYFARKIAVEKRMNVSITIFDGKDFTRLGPVGCNMCAGILSETLLNKLEEEGLSVPDERIQRRISGYYLQTQNDRLLLTHPKSTPRITTVFRGNGPRFHATDETISFDDFLLARVKSKGVEVISEPVKDILLAVDPERPVRVIYGDGYEFEADLVVGAFGVNSALLKRLSNYSPPKVLRTCQAEIYLGQRYIRETIGNNICTFRLGIKGMRFAAFVPKSDYITVTVVCENDASRDDLLRFLGHPEVRGWLPNSFKLPEQLCVCFPRIPIKAARNPFDDRFVIIGDASFSRYFKNGIESAYLTAKLAAETAFKLGISKDAFQKGYFKQAKKQIIRDNFYGRLLLKIDSVLSKSSILSEAHLKLASPEDALSEDSSAGVQIRSILWNMLTGNIPYKAIFFQSLKPALQLKLSLSIGHIIFKRAFRWILKIAH